MDKLGVGLSLSFKFVYTWLLENVYFVDADFELILCDAVSCMILRFEIVGIIVYRITNKRWDRSFKTRRFCVL